LQLSAAPLTTNQKNVRLLYQALLLPLVSVPEQLPVQLVVPAAINPKSLLLKKTANIGSLFYCSNLLLKLIF